MIVTEDLYGADADGNRGVCITEVELEESDKDELQEHVREIIEMYAFEEPEDLGGTFNITFDGYEIEDFSPYDLFTPKEVEAIIKEVNA